MNREIADNYHCIFCLTRLIPGEHSLTCPNCGRDFEVRQGIPVLAEKERYWCNFAPEFMKELNADAEAGYWQDAVKRRVNGNVLEHILGDKRMDFRYLLPDLKESRVLDLGSSWGGVSANIAPYCRELFSVDPTFETAHLLDIRRRQDGLNNMNVAVSSAHRLPFTDNYFDIVLLVGVLEWLGADYDFVVSRDYGRKGFLASPESSPAFLQLTALKEIRRVLRPRGLLFIAIENRFFYKHFWGSPDPHTAMPFSSLLPRPLANIYMRLLKKRDYTEYTYSYWGYNRILKKAGFGSADFYAVMPSYREPEVIIPLASSRLIRYFYQNYALKKLKGLKRLIPEAILRLNLMKYFVPSFFVLAGK